jgi:hypothetical protein
MSKSRDFGVRLPGLESLALPLSSCVTQKALNLSVSQFSWL